MSVQILHGDCRLLLPTLPPASFDSCVTDPPYELGFMGKSWDSAGVAFAPATWRLVLDALKPGAFLLAFGGTRTFHRMAVAIEDAGFEIRDCVMWMYGSGFPKSHDVSKGIDAKLTTGGSGPKNMRQRDMGDDYRPHDLAGTAGYGDGRMSRGADTDRDYRNALPVATDAARQWQGWGTALKPAWEPIIVARRPLIGTVAENVLRHGTGALNIDGCRIETGARAWREARRNEDSDQNRNAYGKGPAGSMAAPDTTEGRWPANVIHDGSEEVLAAFPPAVGHIARARTDGAAMGNDVFGAMRHVTTNPEPRADTGTAARFFYSAKASKADRAGSKHPTVKPVALMRYLCRLVTPPGGHVLDPFGGSGTTGEAAALEGFAATLIEAEAEYVADITRRVAGVRPSFRGDLFA